MDFKGLKVDVGDWRLGKGDVRGKLWLCLPRRHPLIDTQVHSLQVRSGSTSRRKGDLRVCEVTFPLSFLLAPARILSISSSLW